MKPTITHKYLREILDDLNEDNFDDLLIELQFSTLLIPISGKDGVPAANFDNRNFVPIFTDVHEFNKFDAKNEFEKGFFDFNFYLELLMKDDSLAFAINPNSECFTITNDFLKIMKPNYIFEQEYQPFTLNEIKKIKNSVENSELNEYLADKSNLWDLEELINRLYDSDLFVLLGSNEDFTDNAEDSVIPLAMTNIPKFLYGIGDKKYLLLFSHDVTEDPLKDPHIFKYTKLVNFPLLIEEVLMHDFDGFILNVDTDNIVIPREHLRNFMKGFTSPILEDYSMYAFTVGE